MNARTALSLARKALRKPPRVVALRAWDEARTEIERVAGPLRGRRFNDRNLLDATGAARVDALWQRILDAPYPFARTSAEHDEIVRRWPGERERVLAAADHALERSVDVLGTGRVQLGSPADWHRDFKTGRRWPMRYGRRMEYAELDRPSDVKVPWEISRLQWLLPAGQAYALTGDERYAQGARGIVEDWLRGNPYALGVNWAIAMEPALRSIGLTWLLHACGRSDAWADAAFRSRFLRALFLHVDFVDRHIERAEINGNHYTADAAALALGGLTLGVDDWATRGWSILVEELPKQVYPDGVDFEGSTAYHRLVGELFALPALQRRALGLSVDRAYVDRLVAMASFTRAYTGPDGLAPYWGDADDGRALPLGGQDVADHRSLPVLTGALAGTPAAGNAEGAWLVGPSQVATDEEAAGSAAFHEGGFYVLRRGADHVFVDCGPVGLAGRGGHGHNDCLSFEASLAGVRIVRDSGSYVYTASPELRNAFRSTRFHSTPRIDGAEQNRLDPAQLWSLGDDARPALREWEPLRFVGAHTGYRRLPEPVTPIRTIELDPGRHALSVQDAFDGEGEHLVEIPLQLAPGIDATPGEDGVVLLSCGFRIEWGDPEDWALEVGEGWVSPSYGVREPAQRLCWSRRGPLRPLSIELAPA